MDQCVLHCDLIAFYVQKRSQQPPDSGERLSSQQQSPKSSAATPSTTMPQPISPTARQQTRIGKLSWYAYAPVHTHTHMHILCTITLWYPILFSEPIKQPQALLTDQPKLDVSLPFSKDMSYEQLAVWLTIHPKFVGADCQQDICKLKGT